MRPAKLTYQRALNVEHAGELLATGETTLIAGGQGLMRDLRSRALRVGTLVDISQLTELSYVRQDSNVLEVGAVTRLAEVAASSVVAAGCPALSEAASRVGDVQIRNRGTAGGNICGSWVPSVWSNDIGVVLVASGGEVVVQSGAVARSIPADEFVTSPRNPLGQHEFIRCLRFPVWGGSAYERLSRRYADASIGSVAAFVSNGPDGMDVGLAAGRIGPRPVPLREVATTIARDGVDSAAAARAVEEALASLDVVDSVQADAAYRRRILPILIRRSIQKALNAGGTR